MQNDKSASVPFLGSVGVARPAPLLSICIPTCNRPLLLKQAIESCLGQRYRPLQIVVSDDSGDDASERLVAEQVAPEGVTFLYRHNRPGLGQSGNVNQLFDLAEGSRLLLLHDDDLLCEQGLDRLVGIWDEAGDVHCVYGKQQVIDAEGLVLAADTEALNADYCRDEQHEGRQSSGVEAGLRQQMPNNAFLIDTALAQRVRYRSEAEVGHSVDADFAIRVGAAVPQGGFVYVDDFVSRYRLSDDSIMRTKDLNHGQHLFFSVVEDLALDQEKEQDAREVMLGRLGAEAVLDAAMAGKRALALRIVVSRHYRVPIASPATIYRLVCIASPQIGRALGKRLRAA